MITEAVILCGGKGTRLSEALPPGLPKCLASIHGRPFLTYLLDKLKADGVERVILALGYGAEHVEMALQHYHGMELVYSRDYGCNDERVTIPLGTGGALRKAAEHVKGEQFLALNGDSYCDYDTRVFARFFEVVATLDVAILLVWQPGHGNSRIGILEEGIVGNWLNAGVYAFKKSLVVNPHPIGRIPAVKPLSLEADDFPGWVRGGKKVFGYHTWSRFIDIGTPERLRQATEFFKGMQHEQSKQSIKASDHLASGLA